MSLVSNILNRLLWLRRSSILRLTVLLSVIFAIGMAIAIFVALVIGQDAIEQRVDTTLEALAGASNLEDAQEQSPAMILRAPDDVRGLPRPFLRAIENGGGTVDLDGDYLRSDIWRVLVTQDAQGTKVMVAVPLESSADAQELLTNILWTTSGLVILITLAIGVVVGLIAQKRLALINGTLAKLAAGDLTARTHHTKSKDDLDDIAGQLDITARELERLVTQTRHLSASIAHDLRTPLARLRAQLEVLPDGDARGAALEEAGQLSEIFDTIMRVARIEATQGNEGFEPVSLANLAQDISDIFGPVVEDGGKTLTLRIDTAVTVQADKQMLVQAMANLIQNALVHGGPDITVTAQGHSLSVSDNGAGVDPSQFDEIIKPMVRLDTSRTTQGSGLGLALVRAVAERHAAELTLSVADPQGLDVTLNFAKL